MGSMSFSVMKPPEGGGFDEKYSSLLVSDQSIYTPKHP